MASVLESYRKLFEIVFEIQVQVTGMERTLIDVSPELRERYQQQCVLVREEIESSKAVAVHLLEKTAGKLRGDPEWQD